MNTVETFWSLSAFALRNISLTEAWWNRDLRPDRGDSDRLDSCTSTVVRQLLERLDSGEGRPLR